MRSKRSRTRQRPKNLPGRPRRIVDFDQIRNLKQLGFSFRQIARCMGLGYGTARRAYLASLEIGTSAAD